jgi:hypothetical protein
VEFEDEGHWNPELHRDASENLKRILDGDIDGRRLFLHEGLKVFPNLNLRGFAQKTSVEREWSLDVSPTGDLQDPESSPTDDAEEMSTGVLEEVPISAVFDCDSLVVAGPDVRDVLQVLNLEGALFTFVAPNINRFTSSSRIWVATKRHANFRPLDKAGLERTRMPLQAFRNIQVGTIRCKHLPFDISLNWHLLTVDAQGPKCKQEQATALIAAHNILRALVQGSRSGELAEMTPPVRRVIAKKLQNSSMMERKVGDVSPKPIVMLGEAGCTYMDLLVKTMHSIANGTFEPNKVDLRAQDELEYTSLKAQAGAGARPMIEGAYFVLQACGFKAVSPKLTKTIPSLRPESEEEDEEPEEDDAAMSVEWLSSAHSILGSGFEDVAKEFSSLVFSQKADTFRDPGTFLALDVAVEFHAPEGFSILLNGHDAEEHAKAATKLTTADVNPPPPDVQPLRIRGGGGDDNPSDDDSSEKSEDDLSEGDSPYVPYVQQNLCPEDIAPLRLNYESGSESDLENDLTTLLQPNMDLGCDTDDNTLDSAMPPSLVNEAIAEANDELIDLDHDESIPTDESLRADLIRQFYRRSVVRWNKLASAGGQGFGNAQVKKPVTIQFNMVEDPSGTQYRLYDQPPPDITKELCAPLASLYMPPLRHRQQAITRRDELRALREFPVLIKECLSETRQAMARQSSLDDVKRLTKILDLRVSSFLNETTSALFSRVEYTFLSNSFTKLGDVNNSVKVVAPLTPLCSPLHSLRIAKTPDIHTTMRKYALVNLMPIKAFAFGRENNAKYYCQHYGKEIHTALVAAAESILQLMAIGGSGEGTILKTSMTESLRDPTERSYYQHHLWAVHKQWLCNIPRQSVRRDTGLMAGVDPSLLSQKTKARGLMEGGESTGQLLRVAKSLRNAKEYTSAHEKIVGSIEMALDGKPLCSLPELESNKAMKLLDSIAEAIADLYYIEVAEAKTSRLSKTWQALKDKKRCQDIRKSLLGCYSKGLLEDYVTSLENAHGVGWPGSIRGRFSVDKEVKDCSTLAKHLGGRPSIELAAWRAENKNAGWKTSPTSALIRAVAAVFDTLPERGTNARREFMGNDPFSSLGPLFVRVALTMDRMGRGTRMPGRSSAIVWHTTESNQFRDNYANKLVFVEQSFWVYDGSAALQERGMVQSKRQRLSRAFDLGKDNFMATFLTPGVSAKYIKEDLPKNTELDRAALEMTQQVLSNLPTGTRPLGHDVLFVLMALAKVTEQKRQTINAESKTSKLKNLAVYFFDDVTDGLYSRSLRTNRRGKLKIHEWGKNFQWKSWESCSGAQPIQAMRSKIPSTAKLPAFDTAIQSVSSEVLTYLTQPTHRDTAFDLYSIQNQNTRSAIVQSTLCRLYKHSMESERPDLHHLRAAALLLVIHGTVTRDLMQLMVDLRSVFDEKMMIYGESIGNEDRKAAAKKEWKTWSAQYLGLALPDTIDINEIECSEIIQ